MSLRLVFTKFMNIVSLEPFHHKPMGMYASGPLKLAIGPGCQLKETTTIPSDGYVMALL